MGPFPHSPIQSRLIVRRVRTRSKGYQFMDPCHNILGYIEEPFNYSKLSAQLRMCALYKQPQIETTFYKQYDDLKKQLVGESASIDLVRRLIFQVAPTQANVLVLGDSGTGKEVMARAIHKHSKRSGLPMVTVNCGAIPEGIIESELFGHKKGSFTGALDDRKGYFEQANKGTIFLDEIGEAPLETQVKLLRVLETGEYMRVGESKVRYTDVRVIAATNKNLTDLVKKDRFRQDLFFRLKTVMIQIPSLRERVEDINAFVERFALEFTRSNEILYRGFMPDAVRIMKQYDWPGNVRELKNFVEKIMVLEKGERITSEMVSRELEDVLNEPILDNLKLNPI